MSELEKYIQLERRITRSLLYNWHWIDRVNFELKHLLPRGVSLPYSFRPFGSQDVTTPYRSLIKVIEETGKFDSENLSDEQDFLYRDAFGTDTEEPHERFADFMRDVVTLRIKDLEFARFAFHQMDDQERLNDAEQGIILLHSWMGLSISK